MISKTQIKHEQRIHRHKRVRSRISGTATRPRLAVFKSNSSLSAQLIDDEAGKTLAAASTAYIKGEAGERVLTAANNIAKKAQEQGIKTIVFDRGGFEYTGIIKTFADAVRSAGLEF